MSTARGGGRIKVCETCVGSESLLCDLEDLCSYTGTKVSFTSCLGKCKSGPNCVVTPARSSSHPAGGTDRAAVDRLVALGLPAELAEQADSASGKRSRKQRGGSDGSGDGKRRRRRDDSDDSGKKGRKRRDGSDESKKKRGRKKRDDSDDSSKRSGRRIITELWTFADTLKLLVTASGGNVPDVPETALQRAQLRSDAMRAANNGLCNRNAKQITEAEDLLTRALALESEASPGMYSHTSGSTPRLRPQSCGDRQAELRLLRGELRGSRELSRFPEALSDFEEVIARQPSLAAAWAEKAKVLRRARRPAEALAALREALRLSPPGQEHACNGTGLLRHQRAWAERCASQLEERLQQEALCAESGGKEFGSADAGNDLATDSGNGSGWWKLVKITGVSWNTCIYDFENHPPAVPHPCPHDAWHVKVRFHDAVREYTPVSTAEEWERGRMKLLVKTYPSGTVSRRFAQLQPAARFSEIDEQRCWVQISVPLATLRLNSEEWLATKRLGLIVGGTGVAPALQLLREVVQTEGAFGGSCDAVLVYSSQTQHDIFLLDELREVEKAAAGRVLIRHTLTSESAHTQSEEHREELRRIPQVHYNFASRWNPFTPQEGPPLMGTDEEAGLRGRVCADILKKLLPAPGQGVRVVVSGPPKMWEDVSAMLLTLGYAKDALVELQAYSTAGEAKT